MTSLFNSQGKDCLMFKSQKKSGEIYKYITAHHTVAIANDNELSY